MTLHIQPDFSGLIPAGKKIQPQAPVPRSKAKTPGKAEAKTRGEQSPAKTKTQAKRNRPAWMRDTIPGTDPASLRDTQAEGERSARAEAVTVTPADVEILPPTETAGMALEPIDYPRGGPQTSPDIERQITVLEAAIEQGESVPVIARKYGVSRQAIQYYISQAKEELELNSQVLDIKLVQMFGEKIKEIVLATDKKKMAKAGVKDLAIAAGIFADKRKELLGPRSGGNSLHLRAVFKGEGALEIHQGE